MELWFGEREVFKMAVGSARPGCANSYYTLQRQTDRLTEANVLAHSSFCHTSGCIKKKEAILLKMNQSLCQE